MRHTSSTDLRAQIAGLWRAKPDLSWIRARVANRGRCHAVPCDRCGLATWLDPLRAMDISLAQYETTGEVQTEGELIVLIPFLVAPTVFLIDLSGTELTVLCPACTQSVVSALT